MLDQLPRLPAPRHAALPMRVLAAFPPARIAPPVATLALIAVLLAGCGSGTDLSRTFGITRDAPDEYTVTTQVPLSMPPDFAVRPPQPGAPRPQQVSEQQQAEQALAPQTALSSASDSQVSAGQQALVQSAGPAAPANIRAQVNGEATSQADQNNGFVDKLMFWRSPLPPGIVVDPQKEEQRIRENAALGRNQDSGDTPIIQPKRKGWLEGLF